MISNAFNLFKDQSVTVCLLYIQAELFGRLKELMTRHYDSLDGIN